MLLGLGDEADETYECAWSAIAPNAAQRMCLPQFARAVLGGAFDDATATATLACDDDRAVVAARRDRDDPPPPTPPERVLVGGQLRLAAIMASNDMPHKG